MELATLAEKMLRASADYYRAENEFKGTVDEMKLKAKAIWKLESALEGFKRHIQNETLNSQPTCELPPQNRHNNQPN